jgi:hypothetical protein
MACCRVNITFLLRLSIGGWIDPRAGVDILEEINPDDPLLQTVP